MKLLIMLVLTSQITVGNLQFDWVNDVAIKTGWEEFTDTCVLKLPANLKIDRNKLKTLIKAGDPVNVKLGYKKPEGDGLLNVYSGYVTGVKPSIPMELECEDEMWKLKQNTIKDTFKNASLSTILKKHFGQWNPKYIDVELGSQYVIDNLTQAQVLEDIKDKFGIYSFMRGGRLIVGLRYDPETAQTHKFRLQENVIEDDLVYKRKDDVRLEVNVVNIQPDGTRKELKIGDSGGEQRTLTFYNIPEKEMKSTAEREMDRLRYDGFRGTFTTFGLPLVQHGDLINLSHPELSDKVGTYWCDKIERDFGFGGYRQKITLGPLAHHG